MYNNLIWLVLSIVLLLICGCIYKSKYTKNINNNNNNIEVYLYYTNWCGHSKNFLSNIWNKLTNELDSLNIKYFLIDGDKNKQECIDRNINGFPTLLFKVNNKYIEYTDKRDINSILNYINKL